MCRRWILVDRQNGILVIAGSDRPEARAQLERLAEEGSEVSVRTLTREAVLGQDETLLMALRSAAGAEVTAGRPVIVRSENWPGAAEMTRRMAAKRYIPDVEQRVATMLARIAEGVVRAGAGDRLIVIGTDTGEAVCRQLQLTEREVIGEAAPGLPVLRVQSALARGAVRAAPSTMESASSPVGTLLLVLVPGGHGEPESLLQAVGRLAAMELA